MAANPIEPVRVWDLPTRVFHWLLAATIVGSVVSTKIGGNATAWHLRDKPLPAGTPTSADSTGRRAAALAVFGACGALVGWVIGGEF